MKHFTFTICMLLSMVSYAQQDPIDTDRPDQTESVYTIPLHWVQLEAGFNVQQNDAHNKEYYSPTLLSKYGIHSRIELRLITTMTTSSTLIIPQGTTYKTALEPIEIGAKIGL